MIVEEILIFWVFDLPFVISREMLSEYDALRRIKHVLGEACMDYPEDYIKHHKIVSEIKNSYQVEWRRR